MLDKIYQEQITIEPWPEFVGAILCDRKQLERFAVDGKEGITNDWGFKISARTAVSLSFTTSSFSISC